MEVRAKAKFLRTSPTKIRLVIDLVRGMEVEKALDQLSATGKWAADPVVKLLRSAIANAENNFELDKNNLFVKEIKVDGGPMIKRWMPKAFGRATKILKRTSHLTVVLGEIKDSGVKAGKKMKTEEPVKLGAHPKKEGSVKIEESQAKEKADTIEKGKTETGAHGAEGRHGHAKVEGGHKKGFVKNLFQRKSG